jgi:spermidine synthase
MVWREKKEFETRNGRMQLLTLFGSERLLAEDHTEQSGSYMNSVWKTAFKVLPHAYTPRHITFFGVGTGGALRITAKRFPCAQIVGVDWDPTLCAIARERLQQEPRITIHHADAESWIKTMKHTDISCVDLFTGSDVAPCVRNPTFLTHIINQSHITFINVYKHKEILDSVDNVIVPLPHKRLKYYTSLIGMYGSPDVRT